MEEFIISNISEFSTFILFIIIAISLFLLSKGADILVGEAVNLSIRWGIPKMIIGATIVSLGTTLPEAAVSVMAAINGNPDLALGNAIGSIIADTGLIVGIAALIGHLAIDKKTIHTQGPIQLGTGILLAILSLPFLSKGSEGRITQWMGFVFLGLLVIYIIGTILSAKKLNNGKSADMGESGHLLIQLIKLILGIALIIFSSKILIPSVEITALRIGIPQSVIASTLVAFGTSLPELVTAITAVRQGHGELAIGNIIGADILNVLFVVGSAAAVTKEGLLVPANFYKLQIPTMLIVLISFRLFSKSKNNKISKVQGSILLGIYIVFLVLNYIWI